MTFPQVILLSGASLFHALPFAQVAAVMPKSWSSANHRQTLRIGHKPCVRLSGSELGTWQQFDLRPQQTGISAGTAYASLPVPRPCQAALLTNVLWRNCIKMNFSQAVLLPDFTILAVLFSLLFHILKHRKLKHASVIPFLSTGLGLFSPMETEMWGVQFHFYYVSQQQSALHPTVIQRKPQQLDGTLWASTWRQWKGKTPF